MSSATWPVPGWPDGWSRPVLGGWLAVIGSAAPAGLLVAGVVVAARDATAGDGAAAAALPICLCLAVFFVGLAVALVPPSIRRRPRWVTVGSGPDGPGRGLEFAVSAPRLAAAMTAVAGLGGVGVVLAVTVDGIGAAVPGCVVAGLALLGIWSIATTGTRRVLLTAEGMLLGPGRRSTFVGWDDVREIRAVEQVRHINTGYGSTRARHRFVGVVTGGPRTARATTRRRWGKRAGADLTIPVRYLSVSPVWLLAISRRLATDPTSREDLASGVLEP